MLSLDTSTMLSEFLLKVASLERQVEVTRQVLSELFEFEPYSVFRLVDTLGKGSLDSADLRSFLISQRVVGTAEEASAAVKQYDANADGQLSLSEFYNLALPATSPTRREIVLSRTPANSVTGDVLYAFTRLLEREFQYHRELAALRQLLASRPDFSVLAAFRSIDVSNLAYIDRLALRDFFLRCRFEAFEEDIDAILRRVDCDGDGRISYLEFGEALASREVSYSPDRRASPLRQSGSLRASGTPAKQRSRTPSPVRGSSPLMKSRNGTPGSQYRTPEKRPKKKSASPFRASKTHTFGRASALSLSPLPGKEETELVHALKQQLDLIREMEAAKVDLVLLPDFNLIDAFRLFDFDNRGYITTVELEDGMRLMNVRALRDESYLLLRAHSRLSDSRLRFPDFATMLTPKSSTHARMLERREPRRVPLADPRALFCSETLRKFGQVLRLMCECEGLAEEIRIRISRRPKFNFYDAFQTLDQDRNGFITSDEFQSLFSENGIHLSSLDLQFLMDRYDKNRDGRISYSEFVQEVTPKSPSR